MKTALSLLVVEFIAFFVATLNFRYCAKGHMMKTFWTDILIAMNSFVVIKLVADAKTTTEMLFYTIGAGIGSLTAMWMTKGLKDGD